MSNIVISHHGIGTATDIIVQWRYYVCTVVVTSHM